MNTRASDLLREPPEGAMTAAEYVLGVLDAASRRDAETRIEREPAFAYDVAAWQRSFAPLIDEIVPVPVPLALWPRIRAAAGIADGSPATPRRDARSSLWQSLGFWRWLSAGAFGAAAASLAALFIAVHPGPQSPLQTAQELVATIAQDDGKALFVAMIDARSGRLVVQPLAVNIPAGRVAELWLIPPGDVPHSLGLLDPQHAHPIDIPANLRTALGAKAIVAVSVEPPGGAPEGKPTGPIIGKGEIAVL